MKNFLLIIFLSVAPYLGAWGQQDCYNDFLNKGIELYDKLQFPAAIENLKSAILCPNLPADLSVVKGWLDKAQNGYFNEMEKKNQEVQDALLVAQKERNAADSARLVAEANRFGLMASNALKVNSDTNALILSYSSLQLISNMDVPGSLENTFGQASHEFFSQTRKSRQAPIFSILAIPDPFAIVLENGKGNISLLDLETLEFRNIGSHQNYLTRLQYSQEHKKLLSTDIDGHFKIWDLDTFESIDYPAHQREVTDAAFAQKDNVFITVSKDQSGKLWDLDGQLKEQLPSQKGVPFDIEVASDGQFLVRSSTGEITVWDADGQQITKLPNPESYIYQAQLSPDGRSILTASADNTARIWNLEGEEVASLSHDFPVRSAVFSPDGDLILTRTKGNSAKVWNLSGRLISELDGHQQELTLAAFSPSGKFIITGAKDNTVKIWNITGKLLYTLSHETPPMAARFSPDERLILTTEKEGNSSLWDLSGNLLRTIPLRATNIIPSVFSSDGNLVISVIDDQTINVCPIPDVAKKMIAEGNLIPRSRIRRLEREYSIMAQDLYPKR